jgi:NAD(P)-dependent dehydrogenase (short-subunit alcohol dehydrogenase family)
MDNQPKKPVAVITGVGPGLGASLVRRFAATYAVAMLARKSGLSQSISPARSGKAQPFDIKGLVEKAKIADAPESIPSGSRKHGDTMHSRCLRPSRNTQAGFS